MTLPSITLVTPSFNQAGYLEKTIESVVAQNYPALEWIIVDAMSTDGTAEILDRHAHLPFLRIVREPDRGQSDAINKGLRMGSGEIAGWLNSDDELLPGALEAIGSTFARTRDAVIVYGGGRKIDAEGNLLKSVPARPFDAKLARSAFFILQPSMFFRREAFIQLGGLNEDFHYAMDWDLLLRLMSQGRVISTDRELAALRCYPGTKTDTGGWSRFEELARIGRHYNGPLDRNHVALQLRRWAGTSKFARRIVDFVLGCIYPERSVMVVGWPEEKR